MSQPPRPFVTPAQVRRLAGKHVQHIVESVTSGCFSFSATPLQAEAARAHGSHLNLVALPIASAVYLLAWLVENTLGVAASVGQGSALRAALAFRGAERGNCYLGCSALLNSWLAVMGFGLASPLVMVGLVGVYAGSFLPRWVSVTRYGTRLSAEGERDAAPVVPRGAVAPLAVNALDEVFAAEPEPAVTAPAPASPTVLATVPAERRQSIAWGAPEDGDGGGRRPGRRQSIAWGAPEDGDGGGRPGRQQSIAWGAQADAAPASPRRDGGRPLGRQPSAAWGAPLSSPLPSPSPSPSASASGAAALLTDSGPSSPALRPDGDAAGGTASSGRQLPRRLSQRRVSHSLVSWSTNIAAVAIVHRARAQVLKRAWSITGTRPRLQPDWALRELADHIEEWHLRPRAFHPLLAPVGFAYETHSRLLHYFAVAQLAGSPAEAGAALIVGFPLYLVGAACLVLAVPLAPVAAVAPLCLPFAEKEGTVLQHGNVWLSMLLLTWLSLGALAHGYARQPDEGYFLLLRWMVLFFWACISASTIGLSRRAGVDTRWYVCMQWLTGLCAASLLASHIAIEVDRAAGTAMAGALTLVALVINVASAAYIGVGVLYFLLSRQSNIGEMVPVASQVLAVEAGQTLAGRKLAVMRRETTLGPAGTIVELHGSSVRAPATGKSMDMTRFASSEVGGGGGRWGGQMKKRGEREGQVKGQAQSQDLVGKRGYKSVCALLLFPYLSTPPLPPPSYTTACQPGRTAAAFSPALLPPRRCHHHLQRVEWLVVWARFSGPLWLVPCHFRRVSLVLY